MIEIERRFLASEKNNKAYKALKHFVEKNATSKIEYTQGYFGVKKPTLRIRYEEGESHGILCMKFPHKEVKGAKYEVEIPVRLKETSELLSRSKKLRKTRYHLPWTYPDGTTSMVEVDVFKGKLRGLIIVEMEKPEDLSAKVFRKAKPSDWWGIEITGDSKWSNYTLAMRTGK